MPIERDHSSLPTGGGGGSASGRAFAGRSPDPEPRFTTSIAEAWHALAEDKGVAVAIPGRRWRASDAGFCSRSVAYSIHQRDVETTANAAIDAGDIDVEQFMAIVLPEVPTNPPTVADSWRMGLGTMVHEALEGPIRKAFPGAEVEVKVDLTPDVDGSAHVDLVVRWPNVGQDPAGDAVDWTVVLELKTMNGFGFKTAATTFKGQPEGPRLGHVLQGAVSAKKLDADELVVGYLAMELLSPDVARRNGVDELGRFCAEWTFTRAEYLPLAAAEERRVARILELLDVAGRPADVPRHIPELGPDARIVNPQSGMWTVMAEDGAVVDSGTTWHCGYCRWKDRCIADG